MKKINLLIVIIFIAILSPIMFPVQVSGYATTTPPIIPPEEIDTPPSVPTSITAVAINDSKIKITWSASPRATSYNIYRSDTSNGSFTKIYTLVGTLEQLPEPSYENTGLPRSTTKYYHVTAVNEFGESRPSRTVSATTTNSSLLRKVNSLKTKYAKSFTSLEKQLADDGRVIKKINKYKLFMRESDSTMLLERVVIIRGNITEARTLIAENVTANTIEEYNALKAQLRQRVKWIKDRIKGIYKEIPYYRKIKGFRNVEVIIAEKLLPQNFQYNGQCQEQWDALMLAKTGLTEHLNRAEQLISQAWTNPGNPDTYSFNYKPTSDELKLVNKSAKDANRYLKYVLRRCGVVQ
jgi:hypothetical protein